MLRSFMNVGKFITHKRSEYMMRSIIKHVQALELEKQVRRLFGCERLGVAGLINADSFECNPFDAAIMVVSYIYAKNLKVEETQLNEFVNKYYTIFTYPDEQNILVEADNYINDLRQIIDNYI